MARRYNGLKCSISRQNRKNAFSVCPPLALGNVVTSVSVPEKTRNTVTFPSTVYKHFHEFCSVQILDDDTVCCHQCQMCQPTGTRSSGGEGLRMHVLTIQRQGVVSLITSGKKFD